MIDIAPNLVLIVFLNELVRCGFLMCSRAMTKKKAVHTVLVAASGAATSKYLGNIQNVVDGAALFA